MIACESKIIFEPRRVLEVRPQGLLPRALERPCQAIDPRIEGGALHGPIAVAHEVGVTRSPPTGAAVRVR
jgi:hypothetical protein